MNPDLVDLPRAFLLAPFLVKGRSSENFFSRTASKVSERSLTIVSCPRRQNRVALGGISSPFPLISCLFCRLKCGFRAVQTRKSNSRNYFFFCRNRQLGHCLRSLALPCFLADSHCLGPLTMFFQKMKYIIKTKIIIEKVLSH